MTSAAVIHGQGLACVDADANFGCRMVRIFAGLGENVND